MIRKVTKKLAFGLFALVSAPPALWTHLRSGRRYPEPGIRLHCQTELRPSPVWARPTHLKANEYYSLAVENLRTYPVYAPGPEPEGYWQMLQQKGPKRLIKPSKLRSETDCVQASKRVFDEVKAGDFFASGRMAHRNLCAVC